MNNNKIDKIDRVKLGHWPRNQNGVVLVVVFFVLGCAYFIHSVLQILGIIHS